MRGTTRAVRSAEPPPRRNATIIDPAWLLHDFCQASAAGDAMVDDRPALRVLAAGDALPSPLSPLSGAPVVAGHVEATDTSKAPLPHATQPAAATCAARRASGRGQRGPTEAVAAGLCAADAAMSTYPGQEHDSIKIVC